MKKLFVSILALTAFAACQSNFNDVDFDAPQGGSVNVGGAHTIYAEVGVGEETKATYGDDLKATWEDGDQIALLQEHADYGKTFSVENLIGIKEGAGTSFASFSGDISVDNIDPRIFHIVYPGSAAEFSATMSQSVTVESDNYHESTWQMGKYSSTGYATCTYNSTVKVTVPTTQSGKWEPYMYASTSEAVVSTAIGAKKLTTLTGAIAIRAVKPDGETPLQLKAVAVTATKPIAGAFTGTAQSVGRTPSVTGDKSDGNKSNVLEKDEMINDARSKLTTKLQGYEATTTSVTKALSLAFAGDQYTVGAEDTAWVEADADGNYTYHLNVAPFEGADLTIMATAVDGSSLVKTISAQSIAASQRKGYTFKWEEATLSVGAIETWYDDCDTTVGLEGNTLYVNNLEVKGVSADHVLTLGVNIDGTLHEATAKSGVLTIDQIKVSGMASNQHTVYAYAKVLVNGQEKELIGSVAAKTVTSIPTITGFTVKTSYSNNGSVAKDNNFAGNKLTMNADLSDAYFKNAGLVKNYTFYYGNKSANPTLGTAKDITFATNELGQYNCYVKIELKNGYVLESNAIESYVTGIPCYYDFNAVRNNDNEWLQWTSNGASKKTGPLSSFKRTCLNSGFIVSPKYGLPNNQTVSVATTLTCMYYQGVAGRSSTFTVGATNATNAKSTSGSGQTVKSIINTDESRCLKNASVLNYTMSLSSSTPYISIAGDKNDCIVFYVDVKYK